MLLLLQTIRQNADPWVPVAQGVPERRETSEMNPTVAPRFSLETLSEIRREGKPKLSRWYCLAGETGVPGG